MELNYKKKSIRIMPYQKVTYCRKLNFFSFFILIHLQGAKALVGHPAESEIRRSIISSSLKRSLSGVMHSSPSMRGCMLKRFTVKHDFLRRRMEWEANSQLWVKRMNGNFPKI